MKNNNFYLVFDLETDSPKPESCNIVEFAAIPVHPRTLDILTDKAFRTVIRPEGLETEEYQKANASTIKWHADVRGVTTAKIIDKWDEGLDEKQVLKSFNDYCKGLEAETFTGRRKEPIPVGYNIINFDIPILKRLYSKHKLKYPLSGVFKVDIMDDIFTWFESLSEPKNMRLDTFRDFFGIETEQAHDAYYDVLDEAKIFSRFLNFKRKQSSIDKFKGAFKND